MISNFRCLKKHDFTSSLKKKKQNQNLIIFHCACKPHLTDGHLGCTCDSAIAMSVPVSMGKQMFMLNVDFNPVRRGTDGSPHSSWRSTMISKAFALTYVPTAFRMGPFHRTPLLTAAIFCFSDEEHSDWEERQSGDNFSVRICISLRAKADKHGRTVWLSR